MKGFDILPPKHPHTKAERKEAKQSNKKANILFMFFLVVIIAFYISFLGSNKFQTAPTSSLTPNLTSTSSATANITSDSTLKILNGSGRFEVADTVSRIINSAGYKVTISENALNLYDKSVIYYLPESEAKAIEIQNVLKDYKPSIQKFSSDSRYSIVIVIGTN